MLSAPNGSAKAVYCLETSSFCDAGMLLTAKCRAELTCYGGDSFTLGAVGDMKPKSYLACSLRKLFKRLCGIVYLKGSWFRFEDLGKDYVVQEAQSPWLACWRLLSEGLTRLNNFNQLCLGRKMFVQNWWWLFRFL